MAKMIIENESWYREVFTYADKSLEMGFEFMKLLKNNKTFIHNREYGPKSSSFFYRKGVDEIFISLPFEGEKDFIILSEELGRKVGVVPYQARFKEVYKISFDSKEELAKKVDSLVNIMDYIS